MRDVDVVVLGGGLAGALLARQLRRAAPAASIVVAERTTARSWKVGEATVDVFGRYLTHRLGLSSYLYEHHLPKNGLRFFFDDEARGAPLEALGEMGSSGLLPFASFQLDRARLERDLLSMNRAQGVEVLEGTKASISCLGEHGAPHVLELVGDGGAQTVRARWLVDASGRASVLARRLGLRVDTSHAVAAAWGRFRGVLDLDDWGPPAFRARAGGTARMLSTNHFCYPGYWVWTIPLGEGVVSLGVCVERARFSQALRKPEGFVRFLREHRGLATMLERAELLDHGSLGQLAHGTSRFVDGGARWALVGDAAAFADPLYSPGGDFIAVENDYVTELVTRDLAGHDVASLSARFDRALAQRFELTLELYRGLYPLLGSFALMRARWAFDSASYLNLLAEPYFLDEHLDVAALERAPYERALGALRSFGELFERARRALARDGRYFSQNVGRAHLDPVAPFVHRGFATPEARRHVHARLRTIYQGVCDELERLVEPSRARRVEGPMPYARLTSGLPLLPSLGAARG